MADAALVLRWDRVVPGREQQALTLFGQALEYYGTLQSDGAIDSYEPILFDPNGSDVNGIIVLRGSGFGRRLVILRIGWLAKLLDKIEHLRPESGKAQL